MVVLIILRLDTNSLRGATMSRAPAHYDVTVRNRLSSPQLSGFGRRNVLFEAQFLVECQTAWVAGQAGQHDHFKAVHVLGHGEDHVHQNLADTRPAGC